MSTCQVFNVNSSSLLCLFIIIIISEIYLFIYCTLNNVLTTTDRFRFFSIAAKIGRKRRKRKKIESMGMQGMGDDGIFVKKLSSC